MATVVVVLFGVADRSSCPALASVITASVVSGSISETEPTNVVLPTPKPPATTILAEVVVGTGSATRAASEPSKSTQHPFHQRPVRDVARGRGGLVHHDGALGGHVTDEHPGHAQRQRQQRGHLRHRPGLAAQLGHGTVLVL